MEDTLISAVWRHRKMDYITSKEMTVALRAAVISVGEDILGIKAEEVLKHINLSLVCDYTSPIIDPKPMVSKNAAVSIIQSISDKDGNSLKYRRLPKIWRVRQSEITDPFLGAYNWGLNNHKLGNRWDLKDKKWGLRYIPQLNHFWKRQGHANR